MTIRLGFFLFACLVSGLYASDASDRTIGDRLYERVCKTEYAGTRVNPPAGPTTFSYFFTEPIEGKTLAGVPGSPIMRCYVAVDDMIYQLLMRFMAEWMKNGVTIQQAIDKRVDTTNMVKTIVVDLQEDNVKDVDSALVVLKNSVLWFFADWARKKLSIRDGVQATEQAGVQATQDDTQRLMYKILDLFFNRPDDRERTMSLVVDFIVNEVVTRLELWARKRMTLGQAVANFSKEEEAINVVLTDLRDKIKINDMQKAIEFLKENRAMFERMKLEGGK